VDSGAQSCVTRNRYRIWAASHAPRFPRPAALGNDNARRAHEGVEGGMESGAAALENYAAQRANATKSDMQARRYLRATSLSSVQTAGPRRSKPHRSSLLCWFGRRHSSPSEEPASRRARLKVITLRMWEASPKRIGLVRSAMGITIDLNQRNGSLTCNFKD